MPLAFARASVRKERYVIENSSIRLLAAKHSAFEVMLAGTNHTRAALPLRALQPSRLLPAFVAGSAEPFSNARRRQRHRRHGDLELLLIFTTEEILVQLFVEISHFGTSPMSSYFMFTR